MRVCNSVSLERRLLFIHIPKNAGSSIRSALELPGKAEHRFWNHYPSKLRRDLFTFCVIRNPWDRLVSLYLYWKRDSKRWKIRSFPELIEDCRLGFPYGRSFRRPRRHWFPQVDYFMRDGRVHVNRILRFENLRAEWDELFGIPLPHRNATRHGHYSAWYTDDMVDVVARYYRRDIQFGGYEFERQS